MSNFKEGSSDVVVHWLRSAVHNQVVIGWSTNLFLKEFLGHKSDVSFLFFSFLGLVDGKGEVNLALGGQSFEFGLQENVSLSSVGEDEVKCWDFWALGLENVLDDLVEWGDSGSSSDHGVRTTGEFSLLSGARNVRISVWNELTIRSVQLRCTYAFRLVHQWSFLLLSEGCPSKW